MKHWRNDTDRETLKHWEKKNLYQWHIFYQKSPTEWPGIEPVLCGGNQAVNRTTPM